MSAPNGSVSNRLIGAVGFALPFLLVLYVGIEAGGYDLVVRNQVGILIWWMAILGTLIGLLPVTRLTRAGVVATAVLAAFAAWTLIATFGWSDSAERGMVEFTRVLTLLGAFMLMLAVQGRDGLRRSVSGVAAAVAIIAVVALASRFHPGWFPVVPMPESFPASRLNYPVEYWNGLAALLAIGAAPLLWLAAGARSGTGKALAAGTLPLLVLACYLTASRGGAIEMSAAIIVILCLHPRRVGLIIPLVLASLGSGALLALIESRPELRDRELGSVAAGQGNEMIWFAILIFVAVAGLTYLAHAAAERGRLVLPRMEARTARLSGLVVAGLAVAAISVALVSGMVSEGWSDFKRPADRDGTVSRLGNVASGERYQVWEAAVEAAGENRLTGMGPGTFEYFWAQNGSGGFVRDAHSLYLESLAELGPVGFVLIVALIFGPIAFGARAALRRGSDERRAALAAAVAGMVAFAIAAGVDWAWELTVLPLAFLALAAAVLGPDAESRRGRATSRFTRREFGWGVRGMACLAGVAAVAVIAIPLAGTQLVTSSQDSYRDGDLDRALDQAESAAGIQPYAASAELQKALILGELGRHSEAVEAAGAAVEDEPVNWRNWLVLSQVKGARGDAAGAKAAFDRARELNPESRSLESLAP